MIQVVCWTLALLVTAYARTYERCELARELRALGMQDHLSTWVCIAYHESRYQTHAWGASGDHGIFQISEYYWCGNGKACGVSCEAMRDDNISDDVRCALQVYHEHTRLQGNGFMAWVVYPQSCTGNTNHWLDQCNLRNGRNMLNDSSIANEVLYGSDNVKNSPKGADVPTFLSISSIYQDNIENVIKHGKEHSLDWYNYKYDNVDELKPPFLARGEKKVSQPSLTKETNTTTTPSTPVSLKKYTESKQFRKNTLQHYTRPTTTEPNKKTVKVAFERFTVSSNKQAIKSTTPKSETVTPGVSSKVKSTTTLNKSTTPAAAIKPVNITNTAYKLPAATTSYTRTTSPAPAVPTTQWWQRVKTTTTTAKPQSFATNISATSKYPQGYSSRTPSTTTKRPASYAESSKTRTTQSIWDLYLNPTKAPKYQPFSFSNNSKYKINIFASGTTAPSRQK